MVDVYNPRAAATATHNATAEKVLRRAEIARITNNLKSRLALASFKTRRGLQNCDLDTLEAQTNNRDKPAAQLSDLGPQHGAEMGGPLGAPGREGARSDGGASAKASATPKGRMLPSQSPKRDFDSFNGHLRKQHLVEQLRRGSPRRGHPSLSGRTLGGPLEMHASPIGGRKRARTLEQGTTDMPAPSRLPHSASMPHSLSRAELDPRITHSPSTPPPKEEIDGDKGPSTPKASSDQDGANLLLYLATSPGRAMMPRTPGTPDFNFNEYCNIFTPSPTMNRPHAMTPSSICRARQRLTFD